MIRFNSRNWDGDRLPTRAGQSNLVSVHSVCYDVYVEICRCVHICCTYKYILQHTGRARVCEILISF